MALGVVVHEARVAREILRRGRRVGNDVVVGVLTGRHVCGDCGCWLVVEVYEMMMMKLADALL